MSNCEKFRDWIITLYVDDETDTAMRNEIDQHLKVCPECREFAQDVEKNLVHPFQNASTEEVPEHVWASIKEKLEPIDHPRNTIRNLWERWREYCAFPRMATVIAGLTVVVLIGTRVFHDHQIRQAKDAETGKYLVYLLGSSDPSAGADEGDNLETPIEQYFL